MSENAFALCENQAYSTLYEVYIGGTLQFFGRRSAYSYGNFKVVPAFICDLFAFIQRFCCLYIIYQITALLIVGASECFTAQSLKLLTWSVVAAIDVLFIKIPDI